MTKQPITYRVLFTFVLLLIFPVFHSYATTTDAIFDQVRQAAENEVKAQLTAPQYGTLKVTAANLDTRLRISHCPTPFTTAIPGKQNLSHNVNVLVSCEETNWQVYVPVRIQIEESLLIATKPLARGEVITLNDLQLTQRERRFQRGIAYRDPDQVVGAKVRRGINAGDLIQGNDICLVCRNDSVKIIAAGGGLNIITPGKAMGDGLMGEQVKVQNEKSRRIIDARITGVGEVSVNF
ncbi:flagellar basal body P-ring formation chaperone FlgA [Thaumasiovibrio sp. DFM-14]|uniref:flagellar basal body P-ring formation chaperone FlgA n=1 Tax=Thaumasiovibrio sp. DFM-14 TaxID=3384792 RepID=UPI00399FF40D